MRRRRKPAKRPPMTQQPTVTTGRTTHPNSSLCSPVTPTRSNRLMRTVGSATDPEIKSQLGGSISTRQKETARPIARGLIAAITKSQRDMLKAAANSQKAIPIPAQKPIVVALYFFIFREISDGCVSQAYPNPTEHQRRRRLSEVSRSLSIAS